MIEEIRFMNKAMSIVYVVVMIVFLTSSRLISKECFDCCGYTLFFTELFFISLAYITMLIIMNIMFKMAEKEDENEKRT